jgi:hypothetical protein
MAKLIVGKEDFGTRAFFLPFNDRHVMAPGITTKYNSWTSHSVRDDLTSLLGYYHPETAQRPFITQSLISIGLRFPRMRCWGRWGNRPKTRLWHA